MYPYLYLNARSPVSCLNLLLLAEIYCGAREVRILNASVPNPARSRAFTL